MSSDARMRLFVAVELPEQWRDAARRARRELERELPAEAAERLRWVDPALMHLTLRFIGEVDQAQLAPLQAVLDGCGDIDVALSLRAAGTFGPAARTQVLWLAVEGGEPLAALAARVEVAVASTGAPGDGRAFRPHLTMARVHRRASKGERRVIAGGVDALDAPPPSPFRARSVVLVRSHLGAAGPRYETLSRHGEAGGEAGGEATGEA
ncbi:MAG: RNA 2',3'-cyclic phosphodiesterase [Dehalococcoidia bacterium]